MNIQVLKRRMFGYRIVFVDIIQADVVQGYRIDMQLLENLFNNLVRRFRFTDLHGIIKLVPLVNDGEVRFIDGNIVDIQYLLLVGLAGANIFDLQPFND